MAQKQVLGGPALTKKSELDKTLEILLLDIAEHWIEPNVFELRNKFGC